MVDLKPENEQIQDSPTVIYRRFRFQHLLWFILGSAIVHGLLLSLFARYEATRQIPEKEESEPIEFVIVPPEEQSEEPPPDTNKRAAENSVAEQNIQPEKTAPSDDIGDELTPAPESKPVPAPTPPAPAPKPQPTPPPEPEPAPKESNAESPEDAPAETPKPEEEPVATRLPPETPQETTPEPSPANEGSASDLLGGDYKRTLADGGGDAFFSPEALEHKAVLNPGQIDALKDLDLSAYFAEIKRRVKQNWSPSYSSEEHQTYLTFNIEKNGQITGLKVTRSSGSEKLDRESVAAVQNSAPFDPLPPEFPLEALEIEFSFSIYLY